MYTSRAHRARTPILQFQTLISLLSGNGTLPVADVTIVLVRLHSARTTSMPPLAELTALFNVLPEIPPPMRRTRQKAPATSGGEKSQINAVGNNFQSRTPDTGNVASASIFSLWFPLWPFYNQPAQQSVKPNPKRRPNSIAAFKQGQKVVAIAAVDVGSPSFFRFGQGGFSEWPMVW